jgi:hypothetical protein
MVLGTVSRDLRDSAHAQVDIDLSILSAIGDTTRVSVCWIVNGAASSPVDLNIAIGMPTTEDFIV